MKLWQLNTSNQGKYEEFKCLFASHGLKLQRTSVDLAEIDADSISVVVHKASQLGQNILVEDTSLDVMGADVGVNVKWLLSNLDKHLGATVIWRVLLAYRDDNQVKVYSGTIAGEIVSPAGKGGFGFDPVVRPLDSPYTLAEYKPNILNARAIAVRNFVNNLPIANTPIIKNWTGPWQQD